MQFMLLAARNNLKRCLHTSVLLTSVEIVVTFSSGNQFFHTAAQSCRAPQILTSARISNGAVQPPLHRTPRAVFFSENFGSFEGYEVVLSVWNEKIWFRRIFGTLVAFSNYRRNLTGWSKAPVNWDR